MKKISHFCLIICECTLILKRSNKEIHKRLSNEIVSKGQRYIYRLNFELNDHQLTEETLNIEMYLPQQAIPENRTFLSVRIDL